MKNIKKKRLMGMAVNIVLMLAGILLSYMNVLGIIPMIITAFSSIALFANAALYFLKYDEDNEQSMLDDSAKVVAKAGIEGLSSMKKR